MGASMSTLGGWMLVLSVAGFYLFRNWNVGRVREAAKAASQRQRLEDRQNPQSRKDNKDKAKRQRGEAYSKDVEESDKGSKAKPRAAKPASPAVPQQQHNQQNPSYLSSDDGLDNREFARQLASVKQGTNLNAPKKGEEKKQKSVKQSRAQEKDEPRVSAPSSTAGVDADDDESPIASPEVQAKDANDISDMLEPKAAGPSVLRLTDTEKAKPKEKKKAKTPEPTETKKQRQNRRKAEADKAAREEAEEQRLQALEAQRRLARISEGRAAKDGSAFMASQKNAWTGNGINGKDESSKTNGDFLPVQPLDTGDSSVHTDASVSSVPSVDKAGSWMSSLPSEEEQMEMLRNEEEWSTVTTKKSGRSKAKAPSSDKGETESLVTEPQQLAPVVSAPITTTSQKATTNGKPAKSFAQKSSFAALSNNDDEAEVEEEWDV